MPANDNKTVLEEFGLSYISREPAQLSPEILAEREALKTKGTPQ